jgi:GAF domain
MSNHSTSQRSSEAGSETHLQLGQVTVSEQGTGAAEPGAGLAFPGEDRGQSLAEMAQRDLDAALQLLTERAQYITGATGAAIALRHESEHDMLCRASAGPNAPELGALLSAEFGLSGESVRTRQPLRCDDAEHDGRVNRESCRELGIASVAVMPVVSDGEVLGVFELFSGKANAFGERDVAALQRLAEMVETAARFARAAGVSSLAVQSEHPELESGADSVVAVGSEGLGKGKSEDEDLRTQVAESPAPEPDVLEAAVAAPEDVATSQGSVSKPLLWSAIDGDQDRLDFGDAENLLDDASIPLALKELRKCEACGFPVSEGRRLCLDCDEKDWRGQRRTSGRDGRASMRPAAQAVAGLDAVPVGETAAQDGGNSQVKIPAEIAADDVPILSAALESPSWLAANKYVLGAIVAVALVIAAVVLLR